MSLSGRFLFALPVFIIVAAAIYLGSITGRTIPSFKFLGIMLGLLVIGVTLVYVASFLEVLLHELGHWVAAKLLRVPVKALMVHRVTLKFMDGKPKLFFHEAQSWASGAVLIDELPNPTPTRIAILYGAGPAVSLVFTGIALYAWSKALPNSFAMGILMLLAILGGVTVSHSLSGTDGHMLRSVFRRDGKAISATLLQNLYTEIDRVRPRDYPMDRIEAAHTEPAYFPYVLMHRFYYFMDRGEVNLAEAPITEAWSLLADASMDPYLRLNILRESAMYFARYVDRPSIAEPAWDLLSEEKIEPPQRQVVLAARAWRDGDVEAAKSAAETARQEFAAMDMGQPWQDHVRDWLDRILDPSIPIQRPTFPT